MNRIHIKALSAVLAFVLAFCVSACTDNDTERAVQGNASGGVIRFSLTGISKNGGTRADIQSNREKAVSSVYVVAFNHFTGKFATGTEADDISSEASLEADWRADLGSPNLYDVYFVANADADLKTAIGNLTKGTSEKSDFFAIIASQDPGTSETDGAFLMTSGEVEITIDNDTEGTLLASPVTVTRASARIDIVVGSDLSVKEINSVELQNRYKSTKVARTGTDTDMTGLTAEDKTYTISGSDVKELRGSIYAYEDPTKSTVIKITAKLTNGTVVTPTVRFDGSHEDVALQRNHLYTVTLVGSDDASVGGVGCTIDVKDWTEAEAVSYEGLSDGQQPSFSITSDHDGDEYTASDAVESTKTNPGNIVVQKSTATDITIKVTGQKIGSTLTCLGRYDNATGTTVAATGVTCTAGTVTNDGNGNIVQEWTISLTDEAITEDDDYLTFQLANKYNLTTAYRNFKVSDWVEPKIGDYYYSDGTWSTERKTSKTVIGLVFCNTPTADDIARGYKNGYVIALKNYADADDTSWANSNSNAGGIMPDQNITQADQFGGVASGTTLSAPASFDLNGLTNTLKIAAKAANKTYPDVALSDITNTTYHAAYKAVHYTEEQPTLAAPTKSSGWYLPSIGQVYLWIWHFGNVWTVPVFRAQYGDCLWSGQVSAAGTAMNAYFAARLNNDEYHSWPVSTGSYVHYWSSTVSNSSGRPFHLQTGGDGSLYLRAGDATDGSRIRPVLAF